MTITKINKKVFFYRGKRIKEGQIAGLDYENAYKRICLAAHKKKGLFFSPL